jgi:hypothetical protein
MSLTPSTLEAFSDALVPMTTYITKGSTTVMTDIRQFHQVDVPTDTRSFSLMITGLPYSPGATKRFSQRVPERVHLDEAQIDEMRQAALAVDWDKELRNIML